MPNIPVVFNFMINVYLTCDKFIKKIGEYWDYFLPKISEQEKLI